MSFLNKRFSLTENFGDKNLIELIKSSHDINNCLTNCSNNGCCKLKDEKFLCECTEYFTGKSCQVDQRPCSHEDVCIHYLKCENILEKIDDQINFDFKCHCKDNFYGKRCENKINLCQNETCSGNGLCKSKNTTIKCEFLVSICFMAKNVSLRLTKKLYNNMLSKHLLLLRFLFWYHFIFYSCY